MATRAELTAVPSPVTARTSCQHTDWLVERIGRSVVTLIATPAGFGKTALLERCTKLFQDHGRPVFRFSAQTISGMEASFVMSFSICLGQDDRPVVMVDDAHLLAPETLAAISGAIRRANTGATIVIAARGGLPLSLARLRAGGQVVDIGADCLRLTAPETARMLSAQAGGPVDMAWANHVHELSAGWSAGIMLAAQLPGLRNTRSGTSSGSFARRWQGLVNAYFDEEVLAEIGTSQLEMLQRLAVPQVLTAALATILIGDASAMLDDMMAAGLFIAHDQDEPDHICIDTLFRGALLDRFARHDHAGFIASHVQAVAHAIATDDCLQAIGIAQASGHQTLLVDTLERVAEAMCYVGAVEQVVAIAATFDDDALRRSPSVLMCLAWWWMRALDIPAAERLLRDAEAAIDAVDCGNVSSTHPAELLRLRLRHRNAMLLGARDDMVAAGQAAASLLTDLGDNHPYLSCTMLAQLMIAQRESFHFPDALRMEADTRRAVERSGTRFAAIALQSSVAPTLALQGRTATAKAMLGQAVALAAQFGGLRSGLSALAALPLAELCYDLGDLEHASALVGQSLPAVRAFLHLDQLFPGHLVRARLLAADGRTTEALAAIDEAHLIALECGLPRMRKLAMVAQVELLLRGGQLRQAEQAYRVLVPDLAAVPFPSRQPTRCQEAVALAWSRLQLRRLNLTAVRQVAQRWRDTGWRANSLRTVVQFEMILAQAAALDGQTREATRHLRDALTVAAEPGWTQMFLDEGDVLLGLLRIAYCDGEVGDTPADRLAARLLERAGGGVGEAVIAGSRDRLARREIEVVTLVGNGLRNREIGERLGLTEGTVKWYVQQIYDKLGVRRRPQAVARARMLGLIG